MKTAISVPGPLFERVERHARRLGLSRSGFFATAAERFADELDDKDLTAAIDRALTGIGDEDMDFVRRAAAQALGSGPGETEPTVPLGDPPR